MIYKQHREIETSLSVVLCCLFSYSKISERLEGVAYKLLLINHTACIYFSVSNFTVILISMLYDFRKNVLAKLPSERLSASDPVGIGVKFEKEFAGSSARRSRSLFGTISGWIALIAM